MLSPSLRWIKTVTMLINCWTPSSYKTLQEDWRIKGIQIFCQKKKKKYVSDFLLINSYFPLTRSTAFYIHTEFCWVLQTRLYGSCIFKCISHFKRPQMGTYKCTNGIWVWNRCQNFIHLCNFWYYFYFRATVFHLPHQQPWLYVHNQSLV